MKQLGAVLLFAALGVGALVAAVGLLDMLDSKRIDPTAARIEGELNEEMRRIQAPPQSALTHSTSSSKPRMAFVVGAYSTTLTYTEVREHYDAQLSSEGWNFMYEQYLGARVKRCYSKRDYKAALSYEKGLLGQTFSFAMSWGMNICY